jgi:molecular chaperone HscC
MAFIGIDLGTTNSVVAGYSDGVSTLIPNAHGEFLTPSVVSVDDDTGEIFIGAIARERLVSHPALTAAQFKRNMGTSKVFELGSRKFNAEELSSLVLAALKNDAERHLQQEVTQAVISVPAYFNDVQRAATMNAAKLAGLQVERLLNEPTAAAIVHGVELDTEQQFLVLDLGGGTFDVTVLEVFDGVLEVHASAGDNHLGGEVFTHMLVADLEKKHDLGDSFRSPLYNLAERLKQQIGSRPDVTVNTTIDNRELTIEYSREQFNTLVEPLLNRLTIPIVKALKDAKLTPESLDNVLFVGGATRMPAFRKHISRLFKTFPNSDKNPDHVVAMGAAMQAALIARDSALDDVVLTDVMPFSLGTGVISHENQQRSHFSPIIERNTTIPVSRMSTFSSVHPNQKSVTFDVYQGESRDLKNNLLLGELNVELPDNNQIDEIEVRYTYDANGLLEVEATVLSTGHKKIVVLQNNAARMTDEEIEASLKKLKALKIHPADKEENKLLLARGERLFEFSTGQERQYISQLMSRFDQALSTQDDRVIEKARQQINALLDELEPADLQ